MINQLRVTHIEPMPEWIRGFYDSSFEDSPHDLQWASGLTDDMLFDALNGTEVIVTGKRRVTKRIIDAAGSGLRFIQVVGRAPWAVDIECAGERGIPVSFLPHRGAIAVAEHTLALLLGIMRKLVPGHQGSAAADYTKMDIEPIRTSERVIAFNWLKLPDIQQLYGKTLGLVGLGDIGLEVARRARAFDMDVLYTKRTPLPPAHAELAKVRYAALGELLEASDVVSLHAPQTEQTTGLIDAEAFNRMKDSAVLINTARGGLVDEIALVDALKAKSIAGAGLDVFLDEPLPAGHALVHMDNVLLSPHTGGGTGGGQKGVVADVTANIDRIAKGEAPLHLVSP